MPPTAARPPPPSPPRAGGNSSVLYGFNVGNDTAGNMSVVAVARVLNGLVNMLLYVPGGAGPQGLPDDASKTLFQNLASSEKFIYVPAARLRPGRYFIKLTAYSGAPCLPCPALAALAVARPSAARLPSWQDPQQAPLPARLLRALQAPLTPAPNTPAPAGNPTFTLNVYSPPAATRLVAEELAALKEIGAACCKGTGVMQSNTSLQAQFDFCNTVRPGAPPRPAAVPCSRAPRRLSLLACDTAGGPAPRPDNPTPPPPTRPRARTPCAPQGLPLAGKAERSTEEDFCHQAPNVCNAEGRLTRLIIPFGGLTCASFPAAFGAFKALRTLDLTMNSVADSLDSVVKARRPCTRPCPALPCPALFWGLPGGLLGCSCALMAAQLLSRSGRKAQAPGHRRCKPKAGKSCRPVSCPAACPPGPPCRPPSRCSRACPSWSTSTCATWASPAS
jgi:hypothetical protein